MTLPPLLDLGLFMGLVLAFALFGLTASGHFPSEHRAETLRTGLGALILWGTIAAAVVVLGAALLVAAERLPLYASIIGGGAMLLVAPLVLQGFPDSFVDGRTGLLTFAGVGLLVAVTARYVVA
jgi:hypothetical protein